MVLGGVPMLGIIGWRTHRQAVPPLENDCSMMGIGDMAVISDRRPCCGIIAIETFAIDRWCTAPFARVIGCRMEQSTVVAHSSYHATALMLRDR
jgi:hypothetical protein